jgi:hypothetical protein
MLQQFLLLNPTSDTLLSMAAAENGRERQPGSEATR